MTTSQIPWPEAGTSFAETSEAYEYRTKWGTYRFSKKQASSMVVSLPDGTAVVPASGFLVADSSSMWFPGFSRITNATDQALQVEYELLQEGVLRGIMLTNVSFVDDPSRPPKLTAELRFPKEPPSSEFKIVWLVVSTFRYYETSKDTVTDLSALGSLGPLPSSNLSASATDATPLQGTRRLLHLDWSDAGGGELWAGALEFGSIAGEGFMVRFQANATVIDPTLIVTQQNATATAYTSQKKMVTHEGYTYAFWSDWDGIYYSSSREGTIWSPPESLGTGEIYDFDVDRLGETVAVLWTYGLGPSGWIESRKGRLTAERISWYPTVRIDLWINPDQSGGVMAPVTLAASTDGRFWSTYLAWNAADGEYQQRFLWTEAEASVDTWVFEPLLTTHLSGSSAYGDVILQLLALPEGRMVYLEAPRSYSSIWWRAWEPYIQYAGGGSWDIGLPSGVPKWDTFSATSKPDGSVHIAYLNAAGELAYARITETLEPDYFMTVVPNYLRPAYPAISVDETRLLHILYKDQRGSAHFISGARERPNPPNTSPATWVTTSPLVDTNHNWRTWVTVLPRADSLIQVMWTEREGYGYSVVFGALPVPFDVSGSTGDAWNRPGLSPYQPLESQGDEHISPGTGGVVVRQVDAVLKGRGGLELPIARVYVSPRLFTESNWPYFIEPVTSFPWARLDYWAEGPWSLDFPWIDPTYVHLWGGQSYIIEWEGNRFVNRRGERFELERTVTEGAAVLGYTLWTKSGLRWTFDEDGSPTQVVDLSGNAMIFTYGTVGGSKALLSVSEDAGRSVAFGYGAGPYAPILTSVTTPAGTTGYAFSMSLDAVTDPLGRVTSFTYDQATGFLLATISYPTGASTEYVWQRVEVGTEFYSYLVTLRVTWEGPTSLSLSYTLVDGRIARTEETESDGQVIRGSKSYNFVGLGGSMLVSTTTGSGTNERAVGKVRTWFDADGNPIRVERFDGESAEPGLRQEVRYDDWGNPLASWDSSGARAYATFANTETSDRLGSPDALERVATGKLFYDGFETGVGPGWSLQGAGLSDEVFDLRPPSLHLSIAPGGTAFASHDILETWSFVFEAKLKFGETATQHYVRLRSTGGLLVAELNFASDGWLYSNEGSWESVQQYEPGTWYSLALVSAGTRYAIYLDAKQAKVASFVNYERVGRFEFEVSGGSGSGELWIQDVKVSTFQTVAVSNLPAGYRVELYDYLGYRVDAGTASTDFGIVVLDSLHGGPEWNYRIFSPMGGSFLVYDAQDNLVLEDLRREVWGGDEFEYRPGFDVSDDMFYANPTESFPKAHDRLLGYAAADNQNLSLFYSFDTPAHPGNDSSGLGRYGIAVGTTPGSPPRSDPGDARDFEGSSYIGAGDVLDPGDGDLSVALWLKTTATTGDRYIVSKERRTGPSSPGWYVAMHLTGTVGTVSAHLGDGAAGVTVTGTRRINDGAWHHVAVVWDRTSSGEVRIFVDGTLDAPASIAPVTGSVDNPERFYVGAEAQLQTSAFWIGSLDEVRVYPAALSPAKVDLLYRLASSFPVQTYIMYDETGRPMERKTLSTDRWATGAATFDGYGNPTSLEDATGHVQSIGYSSLWNAAYPSAMQEFVGGLLRLGRVSFDFDTGLPTSSVDPHGAMTRYRYDPVGRLTNVSEKTDPPANAVLWYDMETPTTEVPSRMEDLSDRAHEGTVVATRPSVGRYGGARSFDGDGDAIQASFPWVAGGDISWTVSIWMRWRAQPSRQWTLFAGQLVENGGVQFSIDATGRAEFGFYGGTRNEFSVAAYEGTYAHYVTRYDAGSRSLVSWVDGRVVDSDTATGSPSLATGPLTIGSKRDPSESDFEGDLDELWIFDAAISEADVQRLLDGSLATRSSANTFYDDPRRVVTRYSEGSVVRTLHFDMETMLATSLEDLSGQGNHGTLSGTTDAPGRLGRARSFNGGTDVVVAGPSEALNSQDFTLAFWVNPSQLRTQGLVDKTSSADSWRVFMADGTGAVEFDARSDAVNLRSTTPLSPGTWSHVVVTFDGTMGRMYINGVAEPGTATGDFGNTFPSAIRIGGLQSNAFAGLLDEVHLIDRALSASEVERLFRGNEDGRYEKEYYDGLGRPGKRIERDFFGRAASSETFVYGHRNRVVQYSDPLGRAWTYEYDFLGRLLHVENPDGSTRSFAFDDTLRTVTTDDEAGRRTVTYSDVQGRPVLLGEWDPGRSAYNLTALSYDLAGNLAEVVDAEGKVTRHDYDFFGRPIRTTYPDAASTFEAFTYDDAGNLATKRKRDGSLISYAYWEDNQLKRITYPGGSVVDYEYYPNGRLRGAASGTSGSDLAFEYDSRGRVTSESLSIDGYTRSLGYAHDDAGLLSSVDYGDRTIAFGHDGLGRTSRVLGLAAFRYDVDHSLLSASFGNGMLTTYAYDAERAWPTSIQAVQRPPPIGNGATIQWTKSSASPTDQNYMMADDPEVASDGDETYVTSSTAGKVDLYAMAPSVHATEAIASVEVHMVARTTSSGQAVMRIRVGPRSSDGDVKILTPGYAEYATVWPTAPDGNAWSFRSLSTLQAGPKLVSGTARVSRVWVVVNGLTPHATLTYAYDASGDVTSLATTQAPHSSRFETFAYDGQDRLIAYTTSDSWSEAYEYDAAGNRLVREAGSATLPYAYAEDHRLTSYGQAAPLEEAFEGGTPIGWTPASGTWQVETEAGGNTVYSGSATKSGTYATWYDGGIFRDFTYTARVQLVGSATTAQLRLRYDGANSLIVSLSSMWLDLSGCGNAYQVGVSPGTAWHTLKVVASGATIAVYYDDEPTPRIQRNFGGCLARGKVGLAVASGLKPHAHFDDVRVSLPAAVLQYDGNGNLVQRDTGTWIWTYGYDYEDRVVEVRRDGVVQATYAYDALGRRVKAVASGVTTYTLHSGLTPMIDWTSASRTDYVYGGGLRIAQIAGATTSYVHADALGSTRLVTDAYAERVFAAAYNPFGVEYGGASPNAWGLRFTGERRDAVTGLYHLGVRDYDPETGRFLQQDPILGSLSRPQTLNRYAYVTNNPLRYVDPTGLKGGCAFWDDEACWGQSEWTYRLESSWDTDWRAWGDLLFTAVGFIPLIGDVASTAWFLTWDLVDCATSGCDWAAIGLDLAGVTPFVPNLGGLARTGGRALGGLPFLGLVTRHGDEAADLARGAGRGRAIDDMPLPRALRGGPENVHIYFGLRDGKRVYVGITSDVARRQGQHGARFVLDPLRAAPVTKGQARSIEQALIVRNPGFENLINSISPRQPWYSEAVEWGEAWLKSYGW